MGAAGPVIPTIAGCGFRWWFLLVAALPLLLLACRQEAATDRDYRVEISVSPERPSVGPAEIAVRLFDGTGTAVKGATVEVEGNMNHAGMVPVRAVAEESAAGGYLTRDFRFTMGGDWIITVRAGLPGGRVEKSFDLKGVSSGQMQMEQPAVNKP
ncbi:MAG TPA: FixH family protein [Chloroflexota bacterium]|nr:FixH family protein [Chloroflexota bacterium]